jgi:hypothetical protein
VADAFGALVRGRWEWTEQGWIARQTDHVRRPEWRKLPVTPVRAGGGQEFSVALTVHVPQDRKLADGYEEAAVRALRAGVGRAAARIGTTGSASLGIYVYPDRSMKKYVTGSTADGHAAPAAGALHVVAADAAAGGPLERLARHEGAHVLALGVAGMPGTPLMGEGLAVWAAGGYGGRPAEAYFHEETSLPPPSGLLGSGFAQLPEAVSYPAAGLWVEAAIEEVGLNKMLVHLYPATAAEWKEACKAAGTSASKLERRYRERSHR